MHFHKLLKYIDVANVTHTKIMYYFKILLSTIINKYNTKKCS